MRSLILLLFVVLSINAYSQKLKTKLSGDWVCTGITDINGKPTAGKFGQSNEYLRFSFNKNELSIVETPFDHGIPMTLSFPTESSFDWAPNTAYEFPEKIYTVKELDSSRLVLTTKGERGEITYNLVNQKNYPFRDDNLIDFGMLIVKHIQLSGSKGFNKVGESHISNDPMSLPPGPTFVDSRSATFAHIFSINISLPEDLKPDEFTDEMIVEFAVSHGGAGNFRTTKGLSDELNNEVLRVMEKLGKRWKPVTIDGREVNSTCRFHIKFAMGTIDLPFR